MNYSEDQLREYAERYELTIAEAIEYQMSCHLCGKQMEDVLFDGITHQYCGQRCFTYCEEFYYLCFREENCRVCTTWQYHENRRLEENRYNEFMAKVPILCVIESFKELRVYAQLFECLSDLDDYFA